MIGPSADDVPAVPAARPPARRGLTSEEAAARLRELGPNAVPDEGAHPVRRALASFWGPVPWMLEATVLLTIARGRYAEAVIVAGLLLFNAGIGFLQESRARATLAALRSRLALNATVCRDGRWTTVPAAELVPGDLVALSLGAVVPADVRLTGGGALLDHSAFTGESVPVEAGAGAETFAGALVRRGEAVAEVTATGARTRFGRTAELVRTAHVVSAQQRTVLQVVRDLAAFNGLVVVALVACAWVLGLPADEIVRLVLTAMLASIPVALPATFTLASAVGARALARRGVLLTRLSAVDEAATMNVLCSDKTGTLTRRRLAVTAVRPMPGFDETRVVRLAALASSSAGPDPVDAAIRSAAAARSIAVGPERVAFVPFDPSRKRSEATIEEDHARRLVVKGAFAAIAGVAASPPEAAAASEALERAGYRVLGVAIGAPGALRLAGLVALSDPPRDDAARLIEELRGLGVRTVMVTGDAPATAAAVARQVGLDGPLFPPGPVPADVRPERFAVFAGLLPEDKLALVRAFQQGRHAVGMCGDGVNDAPALRQAQIGIAVSTATDVARSAAGMVLTEPGLAGIVAAVTEGRVIFQRIVTYTVNSIVKKVVVVLFLAVGLLMTGHAVVTPMLMVIVMLAGDFLSMSLTTDHVRPSPAPNAWNVRGLTTAAVLLGLCELAFCVAILAWGQRWLGLDLGGLRTLAFLALVFGGQATIYAVRQRRRRLWASRPSAWLVLSSVADVAIAALLAAGGIAMVPLPLATIALTFAAAVVFAFALDLVKIPVFARSAIT